MMMQNKAKKKRNIATLDDKKSNEEHNDIQSKRRKVDSSNNEMALESIQENEDPLHTIRGVVKFMLVWIWNIADDIIETILQYNICNVWYKTGWSAREMFVDYVYTNIDAEITNIHYGIDLAFLQTRNGEIWCKGSNDEHQLGLCHHYKVKEFLVNDFFIKEQIKIKNIWSDKILFTMFQDETGKIYGCGYQTRNQFGFGFETCEIVKPELVIGIENVEQIAIGHSHCIVLDRNGTVYTTKIYLPNHGQNGTGSNNLSNENNNFHPIPFFNNIKIIAISAGLFHTLFVTENGMVWSCGINKYGQLGYGYPNNVHALYPKKIEFLIEQNIKIQTCASGHAHNLLLDEEGNVYAFGRNCFGECGLGETKEEKKIICEPTMITMDQKFDNIQCGRSHNYMKSVSNIHFLFGDNQRGQSGLLTNLDAYICKPLMINEIVKNIIMGEFIEIKKVCVFHDYTFMNLLEQQ